MSNRATPIVAFGFDLGDGTKIEIPGWDELVDATDNCDDKEWPVELVTHGHCEYRFWFVAIRGTVKRGGDWGSAVRAETIAVPSTAQFAAAKAWCDERKIPWAKPELIAMAAYD